MGLLLLFSIDSISSSYNKSVKIRLVATCHLQPCNYNLLGQLAASLWITSFDNKLVSSILTRILEGGGGGDV